jgi:hypothetical protein
MSTEATAAIIIAVISLIGVIISYFVSARKNDLDILRGIIDELRKEVDELKAENADLKAWAERLCCQIIKTGNKPVEFIRRNKR